MKNGDWTATVHRWVHQSVTCNWQLVTRDFYGSIRTTNMGSMKLSGWLL
jgi:hypothetical protein